MLSFSARCSLTEEGLMLAVGHSGHLIRRTSHRRKEGAPVSGRYRGKICKPPLAAYRHVVSSSGCGGISEPQPETRWEVLRVAARGESTEKNPAKIHRASEGGVSKGATKQGGGVGGSKTTCLAIFKERTWGGGETKFDVQVLPRGGKKNTPTGALVKLGQ